MPLACDPRRTVSFRPMGDDGPEFRSRLMTASEHDRVQELCRKADTKDTYAEARGPLLEAIGIGVVSWDGLKTPGGDDVPSGEVARLPDALTDTELWDVAGGMVKATRLGERDAKKSDSPSPSDAANSAPNADATAPSGAA